MKSNKILQREFANLVENPSTSAFGPIEESFDTWNIHLVGPEGTPYEGGIFVLRFDFPDNYPFKPPKATFVTKVYHPSIKKDSGEICKEIYEEDWVPTKRTKHVIDVIKTMLINPNTDYPLETDIAEEFIKDRSKFETNVREWVSKYAKH